MKRFAAIAIILILVSRIGSTAHAMDLVRRETKTDEAVAKYGVTGKGVTIVILDRGIDLRHPDFIKVDGTTRIKWLLDMSSQNSCDESGQGTPPPVEYSETQINAALASGPSINSRDAIGHGTVTAGIAAGNGRAFANGKYRGVAPEADLVIVKLTSEGVPAHDGELKEAPFQGCIDEALDWLDKKIRLLGTPAVALINSGTQWGPIDGTSAVSRKIDKIFGLNRPGRVYISPSGDEGGLPNHAGGTYTNKVDTIVKLTKANLEPAYLQIWYTGAKPAQVTVAFADGMIVGPVGPGESQDQDSVSIVQYEPGQEFYPWQSTSGDRAVWINITGHQGFGSISLRGLSQETGRFDIYEGGEGITSFNDHLMPGRLTDYSSTHSVIVVGAHVNKTSWVDIDGNAQGTTSEGMVGELWKNSSFGPTRDGRLYGVDLTAPGHNLFAAYAPRSFWGSFRINLIQDGGGFYGAAGATSGAAPIVVGTVALMLQLNPHLTAQQVRQILHDTAAVDRFTGVTPNVNWGFGKLDVLAALDAVAKSSPTTPKQQGFFFRIWNVLFSFFKH